MKARKRKSRARQKPSARQPWVPPTDWDMGPQTAAQAARRVIEPADWVDPETGERKNPNGVKRARKLSMATLLWKRRKITKRQHQAAEAVLFAWEKNQRTPPAIKKVQVDVSSKPDAHIAILMDRISAYSWVSQRIPEYAKAIIIHVCRDDKALTEFRAYRRNSTLALLKEGLDELADGIGI